MTAIATAPDEVQHLDPKILESLILHGDLSKLTPLQKVAYVRYRAQAAGLDPDTAPFQILRLQGRELLYAGKEASNQLASKHGVVCDIKSQVTEHDIRIVTVHARTRDGRETDEIGAVSLKGKSGDDLCNQLMKAVTKAKRRAILSVCGLGMLDETELETIKGAEVVSVSSQASTSSGAATSRGPGGPLDGGKQLPPASSTVSAGGGVSHHTTGPEPVDRSSFPSGSYGPLGEIPLDPPISAPDDPRPADMPPIATSNFQLAFGMDFFEKGMDAVWFEEACLTDAADPRFTYKAAAEQMPIPLMDAVQAARKQKGLPSIKDKDDKGWTVPELRASAALRKFNPGAYAKIGIAR